MTKTLIAAIAVGTIALAGCANNGGTSTTAGIDNRAIGAVVGGLAGGVAGSQFGGGTGRTVATIAGSLIGAGLGAAVVDRLNQQDLFASDNAAQQSVSSGQQTTWSNPQTGNSGVVEPGAVYRSTSTGQDCRPFKQTIYVEGDAYETATGTACRQADGTWRIVG